MFFRDMEKKCFFRFSKISFLTFLGPFSVFSEFFSSLSLYWSQATAFFGLFLGYFWALFGYFLSVNELHEYFCCRKYDLQNSVKKYRMKLSFLTFFWEGVVYEHL